MDGRSRRFRPAFPSRPGGVSVQAPPGGQVGYIRLSEFNSECKARVADALREMNSRQVSRIVLDMRSNGGGVLDAAIGIAGLFSEKPLVLFVTDAGGAKQPLYSREPEVIARQPLQVGWAFGRSGARAPRLAARRRRALGSPARPASTAGVAQVWVNGRTASSAEVLAAALKDNCRARLVGSKTFGKGIIQVSRTAHGSPGAGPLPKACVHGGVLPEHPRRRRLP